MRRWQRLFITALSTLAIVLALGIVIGVLLPDTSNSNDLPANRLTRADLEGITVKVDETFYDRLTFADSTQPPIAVEQLLNPDGTPREPPPVLVSRHDTDTPWLPSQDALYLILAAAGTYALYRVLISRRLRP